MCTRGLKVPGSCPDYTNSSGAVDKSPPRASTSPSLKEANGVCSHHFPGLLGASREAVFKGIDYHDHPVTSDLPDKSEIPSPGLPLIPTPAFFFPKAVPRGGFWQ